MAAQQAWPQLLKENGTLAPKQDDSVKNKETLGLAKSVFKKLLVMCNLGHGKEDKIPSIWIKLSEKGVEAEDKKEKVRQHLADTYWNSEAKVIPFAPLADMVYKRKFEGEVSQSSLKSAAKGLTPFALLPLSDTKFDLINKTSHALEVATQTTVKDVTSNGFKAESPNCFAALTKWIKRFNNLLYALFGKTVSSSQSSLKSSST